MMNLMFDVDTALGVEGGDIDDAIALAYLAGLPDAGGLRLITTVAGNVTQPSATRSALLLREVCRLDAAVAAGAVAPLDRALRTGQSIVMGECAERWIFPRDAAEGPIAPAAWDAMADLTRRGPTRLLATAPLTNVARFLRSCPKLKSQVTDIVTMGGWFHGDQRGPEFNIMVDPVAAAEVYASGLPMVVAPLEMTLRTLLREEDIEPWRDLGEAGRLFYDWTRSWISWVRKKFNVEGCNLHDPLAAVCLTNPEIAQTRAVRVQIDRESGRTEVIGEDPDSPVRLIVDFDREAFMRILLGSINGLFERLAREPWAAAASR